jgi:acetolactate synthase-1/3 small subunit
MLHSFVVLVEDKPGALTRVASLFRRLNYNIASLAVGHSERPGVSRMTLVAEAPADSSQRIAASLYKLVNVLEVDDVSRHSCVTRELALIKVSAGSKDRSRIFELAEVFRARVVDLTSESIMLEITGGESKVEGLLQVLNEGEQRVLEITRSGRLAMRRGHHTSRVLQALGDAGSQAEAAHSDLSHAAQAQQEAWTEAVEEDLELPGEFS